MLIKSLELDNYRNYKNLKIDFDKGVNILYGNNAQGKTNILEAIYLAATTKSHRGTNDRDIIRFGAEEGHLRKKARQRAARAPAKPLQGQKNLYVHVFSPILPLLTFPRATSFRPSLP